MCKMQHWDPNQTAFASKLSPSPPAAQPKQASDMNFEKFGLLHGFLLRFCFALPHIGRCPRSFPMTAPQNTVCHTHQNLCSPSLGCNSPQPSCCQADAACGCWRQHTSQTPHCCLPGDREVGMERKDTEKKI